MVAHTSRSVMPPASVLRAREKLVLDHFHDEVRQDWDATMETFPHPHYELIALRHCVDAVIAEFWLLGTHRGPLGGIPSTGGRHRARMTAYFVFDEGERLVAERIYFDQLTVLRQLIAGLNLRSPKGLLTLGRVLVGALRMSGGAPDPRLTRTAPPVLDT
ncbi:ester cyclase [Tsukamurella ocularis]|uniref:ester cyclase n=1 Tax=Tsukamurella ocularis TaxID=1970234 RepID=UPI002168D9F6|nr:ester cyclase [Tsukamurella ocularis]MCS3782169.1 putative ester cyclase [Tsukamurella ocularis]MCS3789671.1 putative ester cyclase [Tsukamurella ocularis]MCS3852818.1 putative ester cyclase [Tsukamurella ocularis]